MKVYTLGHSTRGFEDFLKILQRFGIKVVIDVRKFPTSKKFPHFNKEFLEIELKKRDINYIHFPELGGYRKEGYLNFSKTKEFDSSIRKLLEIVEDGKTVILCAERFWWRCHRKFIAQKLVEMNHEVLHILDENTVEKHGKKENEKMRYVIFCDKKARKMKRKRWQPPQKF